MKRNYILWTLLLLLLTACSGGNTHVRQMLRADRLLEQGGDSLAVAAQMLQAIGREATTLSLKEQMRLRLLTVKARNKQDLLTAADTTMSDVAQYYHHHGSPNERVDAYYLLGRVYHHLDCLPQAIEAYDMAIEAADTTRRDCNYKHLFLVHAQLFDLYSEQRMTQRQFYELDMMEKYALLANDTLCHVMSVFWRERPYWALGQYEEAVKAAEKGISLMRKNGYEQLANGNSCTIIWYLLKQGKADEAHKYMDLYEHHSGLFDENGNVESGREIYYTYKGRYFLLTEKLDSAEYYFRKVIQFKGKNNDLEGGYDGLMTLYSKKKATDSVTKYAKLYCEANEKYLNNMSMEKLEHISSMYDYSKLKNEVQQEKTRRSRTQSIAAVVVVMLIATVLTLVYIFKKTTRENRKKLEEKEKQQQETTQLYHDLLKESEKEKEEHAAQIANDRDLREEKEQEISRLSAIIAMSQGENQRQKKWNLESSVLNSKEVLSMHDYAAKGTAPDSLWLDFEEQVQLHLPVFISKLREEQHGLTELEQRVCILMKLRFLGGEIQNLLDKSPQSITNLRASANRKLFNGEGGRGLGAKIRALGEHLPKNM